MKEYTTSTFFTGFFSGTLDPKKLQRVLTEHAQQGWRLAWTICETRRLCLIFKREAHYLIFERDVAE